jgi:phosphoenolpyruvate carboxykinase (GTP)
VPISAILFGGRRRTTVPLVTEAYDWEHGVFLGSIMASETTAAQQGAVGKLRFDPMAMLPFCGYHYGDYFRHWLEVGTRSRPDRLPRIFFVNWFRRDTDGRFLWPGFGENSRVLKWIVERIDGRAQAIDTPIGRLPAPGSLDTDGLAIADADLEAILSVDTDGWRSAIPEIRDHFASFGERLPVELIAAVDRLERSLDPA